MSYLAYAVIFLTAAAIAAPLAKRLGLGAILGYLIAGVAIGPSGLGVFVGFEEVETVMHVAELGVVLLLFLIGLELRPQRLWAMRTSVFGTGSAQMLITAAALAALCAAFGLPWPTAVLIGLTLALSSTAFALQTLAEREELRTRHGRKAFSILLFQDIAVIPILAVLPFLAPSDGTASVSVIGAARAIIVIALVYVLGRYVLRIAYRLIAAVKVEQALTASALLTVAGIALLMEVAGLSAGLGAFLAGVLLADSEYRHELETDLKPFEGLLLGVFFTAVGMALNITLLLSEPATIFALVVALIAVKGGILFAIGRFSGLTSPESFRLAVTIAQGGEFAFVILSQAAGLGAVSHEIEGRAILVVTLSMAATPLLLALAPKTSRSTADRDFDTPDDEEPPVIIAGFGRFGQITARVLRAKGIRFTALERNPQQVDFVKKFGNKVYYGDASRLDLLKGAGAEQAKVLVIAVDDDDAALTIAEQAGKHFPNLKIYARARDRQHAHRLIDLGVEEIRRETFLAALDLTRGVLEGLGYAPSKAERAVDLFREHDSRRLYDEYKLASDVEKLREKSREAAEELEILFAKDEVLRGADDDAPAK